VSVLSLPELQALVEQLQADHEALSVEHAALVAAIHSLCEQLVHEMHSPTGTPVRIQRAVSAFAARLPGYHGT